MDLALVMRALIVLMGIGMEARFLMGIVSRVNRAIEINSNLERIISAEIMAQALLTDLLLRLTDLQLTKRDIMKVTRAILEVRRAMMKVTYTGNYGGKTDNYGGNMENYEGNTGNYGGD